MDINQAYQYVFAKARIPQIGNISQAYINDCFREAQLAMFRTTLGLPEQYLPGIPLPKIAYPLNERIRQHMKPFIVDSAPIQISSNGYFAYPLDMAFPDVIKSVVYTNSTNGTSGTSQLDFIDVIDNNRESYRAVSRIITNPYALITNSGIRLGRTNATVIQLTYLRWPVDPYWDFDIISNVPTYVATGGNITANPYYKYQTLSLPRNSQSNNFEMPMDTHEQICELVLEAMGFSIRDGQLEENARRKVIQGV